MNLRISIRALIAMSTLLLVASCKESGMEENALDESTGVSETLYNGEYDEVSMDTAMENARNTLGRFRSALESGTGEDHAIKVAIHDGDNTEYFWIIDVIETEEGFKGTLNNEPGLVSNVEFGDEVEASGEDISDWMYILNDQMYGNYTLRVLMKGMAEDEAAFYESKLAPLPE